MANPDVAEIIASTQRDMQQQFFSSGGNSALLIDYVDRVSLDILRNSNWNFMLSTPKRFITSEGQTDYWIGATGTGSTGTVDTGLNLTDLAHIDTDTVWDRSNFKLLGSTEMSLPSASMSFQDGSQRYDRPKQYQYSIEDPSILHIYPLPDNQNTWQPIPEAPYVKTSTSGALAARTYYVVTTFVDSDGNESSISRETHVRIPASKVAVVQSPVADISASASGVTYSQYKVYIGTSANSETLQSTATNIGTNWTEPTSGLVSGAAMPTANSLAALEGYVIEFKYYKIPTRLTATSDVLQVPRDYRDVVVAGVNQLVFSYLDQPGSFEKAQYWMQQYETGKREMLTDKNRDTPSNKFMRPDRAATVNQGWYI